jgi:hypothetical protein
MGSFLWKEIGGAARFDQQIQAGIKICLIEIFKN